MPRETHNRAGGWRDVFFLAFLVALAAPAFGADESIRVGAFDYYPAIFKDDNGNIQGFYVDLLADVATKESWNIEFVYGSWAEGLDRLRSGELDVLTSVAYTEDRAAFIDYGQEPLLTVWSEVYVHETSGIHSVFDLRGKKLAVMQSDFNARVFQERMDGFEIECEYLELPNFVAVFEAVQAERADAGVVNSTFGAGRSQDYAVKSTDLVFNPFPIYFAVAKGKNHHVIDTLDRHLAAWRSQKNSLYYRRLHTWLRRDVGVKHIVPPVLWRVLAVLAALLVAVFLFNIILRNRVRSATIKLRASEDRLRILFEQSTNAMYVSDLTGRLVSVNEQACHALGRAKGELLQLSIWDVDTDMASPDLVHKFFDTLLPGQPTTIESTHRRKDGSTFPVEITVGSLTIADERYVLGIARDISERKRAEADLRESREQYRNLVGNIPVGLYRIAPGPEGKFSMANAAMARMFGYDSVELFMKCHAVDLYENDADRKALMTKLMKNGEIAAQELKLRKRDGTPIWGAVTARVVHNENGEFECIDGLMEDITEQKRTEEALRIVAESGVMVGEDIFRFLVRQLAESQGATTALLARANFTSPATAHTIAIWHDGEYAANFSYPLEGTPCQNILKQGLCFYPRDIQQLFPDDLLLVEMGMESYWGLPVRNKKGKPIGFLSIMHTQPMEENPHTLALLQSFSARASAEMERLRAEEETARLEEQYRQAQKMDAIGQLTGGVAHDFNNLLQVINGATELAIDDLPPGHPALESLDEVVKAGDRASRLVSQLLLFSRRQIMRPTVIALNETIEEMLSMLGRVIGEHIRIEWKPGQPLGNIHADRGMVEQTLMNLTLNARDAMPEGGALTIETKNVEIGSEFVEAHPWANPGHFAMLGVTDTGCGMEKDVLEHIFEPFYTTKETGKGTGLGLATVYGIVKQHDGMIHAYSEPEKGSTFKLYWPMSERPEEMAIPKSTSQASGGTETILLAEDDDLVRNLAARTLQRAGYVVIEARDGEEAVALFKEHAEEIEAAILDVIMPRMGGREAYDHMRSIRPGLKAFFASGYSENAVHTNFVLDEDLTLLQKPFAPNDLLHTLRKVLAESDT